MTVRDLTFPGSVTPTVGFRETPARFAAPHRPHPVDAVLDQVEGVIQGSKGRTGWRCALSWRQFIGA
jgi:hypothetical protein